MAEAWRTARDEARTLLVRELDSARHRRWLGEYAEFARSEGQGARVVEGATPNRVRDTAPSRILAAHEQVRAYEAVLRTADVPMLHELRIAAKWLRYSIEFVREPLGPDAEPLIARVTALQDHLGLLHDADVAAGQARAFAAAHRGSLRDEEVAAIERYAARNEERRAALVGSVGPAWRAVAGLGFRRRLGRVLAGL
ncbi:MAG: CHAD domain-containing protein [Chloroflexi bacterium]|nr:CHAD domain-containing protein [Chloroflexota bacterium]